MKKIIQRTIFNIFGIENYLRILQRSYFILYRTGILRFSKNYSLHYLVKKLIEKNDIVIDIGANLGYYSILFAKWVGKGGHIYAVEPIKIYNKIYKEVASKYDNITLYPYALGLEEKEIEMVSPSKDGYLNTGLPHVYDKERDGKIEDIRFRFKVKMQIPSKLFHNLNTINYIKCDVEGFEYIILSEMKDIISKCKPKIQVEVWNDNKENIKQLLYNLGYNLYHFHQGELKLISTDTEDIQGDYIFIHKEDKAIMTQYL